MLVAVVLFSTGAWSRQGRAQRAQLEPLLCISAHSAHYILRLCSFFRLFSCVLCCEDVCRAPIFVVVCRSPGSTSSAMQRLRCFPIASFHVVFCSALKLTNNIHIRCCSGRPTARAVRLRSCAAAVRRARHAAAGAQLDRNPRAAGPGRCRIGYSCARPLTECSVKKVIAERRRCSAECRCSRQSEAGGAASWQTQQQLARFPGPAFDRQHSAGKLSCGWRSRRRHHALAATFIMARRFPE